jgi:glycosyltransferase involved in cell wall biosynthesis
MEVALFTVHRAVSFSEVNRLIAKCLSSFGYKTLDFDFESFQLPRLDLFKGFVQWDLMIGTMTVCSQIVPYFNVYSQPYYAKKAYFYGVVEGEPKLTDKEKAAFRNRLVVPSKFVYDEMTRIGVQPVATIPHGIDHNEFIVDPKEVEAFREYWKGHKILLYLGNADPRKGVPQMLEALAILKEKMQDWVLLMSTDSKFFTNSVLGQPPLNYIIEKYKLRHWVCQVGSFGHQTRHDIALWLNSADLILHPSFCEGFGLITLESGACHKTFVGVDAPPTNEIVNKDCAYLIPYKHIEYKSEHPIMVYKKHIWDAEDFAETVLYALENPEITKEKGEKNYENSLRYRYIDTYKEFLTLL